MSPYTVNIFRDLRNQHSTWDAMKAFLTSVEGGKLAVKEREGSPYAMVYAKKGVSDYSKEHMKWFRSVVWRKDTNMPVSVMTQKSELENPLQWQAMPADTHVSSYEDGVTLTAFTEVGSKAVQVASRSQFGAGGKFFKNATKSFAAMLEDAVKAAYGEGESVEYLGNILGYPGSAGVAHFGSILVQHPEHRVVTVNSAAKMIVLQLGIVGADGSITLEEKVPALSADAAIRDGEGMAEWFERISGGRDWTWQGVMLHDGAGRRWRIRSPVYQMIRSMRGNTARADERFFGLRAKGLVKTYLIYYPEDSAVFWECEQWLRKATGDLYRFYVDVHKARKLDAKAVAGEWQAHVAALHGIFLKMLRPAGQSVSMGTVVGYMNGLPVPRLLYLMNLRHRIAQGKVPGRRMAAAAVAPTANVDSAAPPTDASPAPEPAAPTQS